MEHMSQEIYDQLVLAMCRPVGSFTFWYTSKDLFDKNNDGGIIFEIPSKGHYFRLDRDKKFNLNLYHSSPGTGTRHAFIDLNKVSSSSSIFICFTWSTLKIDLYLGSKENGEKLIHAEGKISSKNFSIGKDGGVYQIGDNGVKVMSATIHKGRKEILSSTAIETWRENIKAISVLKTGTSTEGYIYEVVTTNLILSMLVTGFESYTKKRFLELEREGITPNIDLLLNNFLSNREREKGLYDTLREEAKDNNMSLMDYIVNKNRINFQDFQRCKTAFNKAYGIKFGEIGIEEKTLEQIQQYIEMRHKIIHVSPLTAYYFNVNTSKKELIFPNKELANQAINDFNSFIEKLHEVTLSLLPRE